MRNISKSSGAVAAAAAASLLVLTLTGATNGSAQPAPDSSAAKPTIVLVHGAWADGSSWAAVTKNLQHKGFTVDVEANPLRGLNSDASYLRDYLATIPGPIVLVGHSYGGMVITNAATGNPNVKALVYINAYLPRRGDTVDQLTSEKPGSALDPNTTIDVVPIRDTDGTVADADLYVKPALFPDLFAAGVSAQQAALLAAGQRPLTHSAIDEASPNTPAWQTIPSWALIGTADRVIPPAEQQLMATRAGAHMVKVNAPHLSMVSDPDAVTDLIQAAAAHS
jgi:pimeloyl-ACP methyl ester carboxylesterase